MADEQEMMRALRSDRIDPGEVYKRQTAELALAQYRTDRRMNALVSSCVAAALRNTQVTHMDSPEACYRVATTATALLLGAIYEGDGELKALRGRVKELEGLVEEAFHLHPTTPTIFKG